MEPMERRSVHTVGVRLGMPIAAFLMALCLSPTAAGAISPAASTASLPAHVLPNLQSLPKQRSVIGKDFRLHAFRAKDARGKALGVPAFLLDVFDALGDWVSPNPTSIPKFPELLPKTMRNKIQLIYIDPIGWLVVPRSWSVMDASIGASNGGSEFEFMAPSGPHAGWMRVYFSDCGECMVDIVAGLIPEASKKFEKAYREDWYGLTPPDARVVPRPRFMKHLDPCTALFIYSENKMTVHGAAILEYGGQRAGDAYVALPHKKYALGQYITRTFLAIQMRQATYSCETRNEASD